MKVSNKIHLWFATCAMVLYSGLTAAQGTTGTTESSSNTATSTAGAGVSGETGAAATASTSESDGSGATAESLSAGAEMTPDAQTAPVAVPPADVVEEATEEAAPETKPLAGYDGGFFIQSGDGAFKLKIGGRIKTRYNFTSTDMGDSADRVNTNNISVPYARLYFSGHLFDKKLTYLINPGFGGGSMKLVLAFADYAFVPKILHLTFGQMKRPFSRNYITSSGKRAFINGPTGEFGNAIDLGLQLSNDYTKSTGLEWAIGIFNSAKATSPAFSATASGSATPDDDGNLELDVSNGKFSNAVADFRPALVLRIGYNNGVKGYWPTDFEGGGPRVGIALSGHTDFNANESDAGEAFLSTDFILKVHGFSFNGGVYLGWDGKDDKFVWDDPEFARLGAFLQAQFLIAKRFEPVLRWGIDDPDGDDNNKQEFTIGFTTYVFGTQNFKWENNVSIFIQETDDDPLIPLTFISQLQFLF